MKCLRCAKRFTKPSTRSRARCVDFGSTKHAPELDDLFKFMDEQQKAMDKAYIECRPCTVYMKRTKINKVEKGVEETWKGVKSLAQKVESISEELRRREEKEEGAGGKE
jgi:hypothetical protein